jgi:hypothetical protein
MRGRCSSAWAEVVAVYRGTPVEVLHVGRPAPRSSRGLIGVGVAMLLFGALALGEALRHDWRAHAEAAATARARGEPRMESPGLGLAGLGAALLLLGVVPLVAGLLRRRGGRDCVIGESHDASFVVTGPERVLVAADGPDLCFAAGTEGEVRIGGVRRSLAWLIASGAARLDGETYRWPLLGGSRCRVVRGEVTFWVRAVTPSAVKVPRGALELPAAPYSGVALVVFAGLTWLSSLVPEDELFDIEEPTNEFKFVGYVRRDVQLPRPVAREAEQVRDTAPGVKAPNSQRDVPRRGNVKTSRRGSPRAPVGVVPGLPRGYDPEPAARSAGILGVMREGGGPSVVASAGYSPGSDDEDVWTGAVGTAVGEAYGVGGLGLVGDGGSRAGDLRITTREARRGWGCGCSDTPRRAVAKVQLAELTVAGGLEYDVVRRVVRAELTDVRRCYGDDERRDYGYGSLSLHFSLAADGSLRTVVIGQDSLKRPAVGACIVEAARGWQFPAPEDGSLTLVTSRYVFDTSVHYGL